MQVKPETVEETSEIINPFVKAMKDQRLDQNYVTSLRKEVIALIEPFRQMTIETAERQDRMDGQLTNLLKDHEDFMYQTKSAFKNFATLTEVKSRDQVLHHELTDLIDKQVDTTRLHGNKLDDHEKKISFVHDLNRTFQKMNLIFTDQTNKVMQENAAHREKIRAQFSESVEQIENLSLTMKLDCDNLRQHANQLEHINKTYHHDKQHLMSQISDCVVNSKKLAQRAEECLRIGNHELRRETEQKMCKFTENLILEFKYLNKRLEDNILFKVGYYQALPDDPRNPSQCWIRLENINPNAKVPRPKSAIPFKLNFEEALDKATESAGERLKNAYQQSVVLNPFQSETETVDMEWEVARLQEYILTKKEKNVEVLEKLSGGDVGVQTLPGGKRIPVAKKRTQFPEQLILTDKQKENLYFKDNEARDQKMCLSLNQIWRFISYEIDKERLIEQKLKKMEEEESSSDEDDSAEGDDEVKPIENRSQSRLREQLNKSIEFGRSQTVFVEQKVELPKETEKPLPTQIQRTITNKPVSQNDTPSSAQGKPKGSQNETQAQQKINQAEASLAKKSSIRPIKPLTSEQEEQELNKKLNGLKSLGEAISSQLKLQLSQKVELICYGKKIKKSRLAQIGYIRDLNANMHTIIDGFDKLTQCASLIIRLIETLEQRVSTRNANLVKSTNQLKEETDHNQIEFQKILEKQFAELTELINRGDLTVSQGFNDTLRSEQFAEDLFNKMKEFLQAFFNQMRQDNNTEMTKAILSQSLQQSRTIITEQLKKNKLEVSFESIKSKSLSESSESN